MLDGKILARLVRNCNHERLGLGTKESVEACAGCPLDSLCNEVARATRMHLQVHCDISKAASKARAAVSELESVLEEKLRQTQH